jgi:hypothetical protein
MRLCGDRICLLDAHTLFLPYKILIVWQCLEELKKTSNNEAAWLPVVLLRMLGSDFSFLYDQLLFFLSSSSILNYKLIFLDPHQK